jgi:YidC/Oxa1 family membrane protein insertase
MTHIYHDEFAVGGMYWFMDLTVPDPLYILPITSAITFLGLIEMGKEQMMAQNAAQGKIMVNVFRGMSLFMLPVCIGFEASMLCYWTANNFLTMGQTALLKKPAVRKYFGIWDPPKPVPGQEPESLMDTLGKLTKKVQGQAVTEEEKIKKHNTTVDSKKNAMRMVRESRARRKGITGTRSR